MKGSCSVCGEVFELIGNGLIPYHDFPKPCRRVCKGSKSMGKMGIKDKYKLAQSLQIQGQKLYKQAGKLIEEIENELTKKEGLGKAIIGIWDCSKSPINLCVYDDLEDPDWDSCIYCFEPDERK